MELITRTVYGSRLQTMQYSQLPFSTEQNTTLNEKFSIYAGVNPEVGVYPAAKFYAIGNGGHKLAVGTGGIGLVENQQHLATDAALYNHLPFVLRATNNDINNTLQQKYALRKTITVNAQNYYAYYLKRIPTDEAAVTTVIQTVSNGVTTTSAFVPSAGNLAPEPPTLSPENVNILSGQYANVSATLPIVLTADECTELLNAAEILYGDPKYAIISEIALVAGVDYPITLPNTNTMNEAIATQVTSFINTMHVIQFTPTGINGSFDVGTNEPLLVLMTI